MKKMLILMSHNITEEQKEDARKNLGIDEFVEVPNASWKTIPPDADGTEIEKIIEDELKFIVENGKSGDYLFAQGEPTATALAYAVARKMGMTPVVATTERLVKEIEQEDGSTKKVSIFKHVRFREVQFDVSKEFSEKIVNIKEISNKEIPKKDLDKLDEYISATTTQARGPEIG